MLSSKFVCSSISHIKINLTYRNENQNLFAFKVWLIEVLQNFRSQGVTYLYLLVPQKKHLEQAK